MNIVARLTSAAVAASFALAMPASAQLTFTGYTNACFYSGAPCTPETTAGAQTDVTGPLVYNNSTFNVTTAGGSAQIGNTPGSPNVNNLGSFTLPTDVSVTNFAGQSFALNVFFTAPASVMPTNNTFMAALSGTVDGNTGGVTINFDNTPKMFSWAGGTFTLEVADVFLTNTIAGTTVAVTGNLVAATSTTVPEPSTYILMASGLAGLGIVARRRRNNA